MPPSSQSRASGPPSSSTTIAIVLVLVIPSVLLLGLCVARRMPWFEPIRRRARAVAPRFTRQPGAAGPQSLQKLPVMKYDEKLFNADPEAAKAGTTANITSKQRQRNLFASFNRLDWSAGRFKERTSVDVHKKSVSPSVTTSKSATEIQMRKLAMQACAICTEDFCKGTNVRKLPCGHIFHPRCIDPWLVNFAATCPLCRIDLSVKEATSRVSKPQRTAAFSPVPRTATRTTLDTTTVAVADMETSSATAAENPTSSATTTTPPLFHLCRYKA
ncbi:hypothetical protein B0T16DRAFT_48615 [Cercophora newfieldiana]|uniref:RING-type E3 ubiquitin transferase n=1 Tax=Cercophora newfieldiana TaxID=92897 RepID=A0AA39YQR6_9PEZI|nr:hypothetical protein B0T16DRAFT_48615 [Cercophora newfieldiana]